MAEDMTIDDMITDLGDLRQKIDERVRNVESELGELTVRVTSLDSCIELTMNSKHEVETITIDPDIYPELDSDVLADEVIRAYKDALSELGRRRHEINQKILNAAE